VRKEARLAFLFILPAVLLLAVIALWPVLRSVWISLYDIRLNDPAKGEVHLRYALDGEKYAQSMPLLQRVLETEAAGGKRAGEEIASLQQALSSLRGEVEADPAIASQLAEIDRLLYDFKPVPDKLKYASVPRGTAEHLEKGLEDIRLQLLRMKDEGVLLRADAAAGLAGSLQAAVIKPNFVGLKHYQRFLADSRMWQALANTSLFTLGAVTMEMLAGLLIALLMNRSFRGRGLVRAAVLIPWATPTAISAMIWHFLYDGQNGVVAKLLAEAGLISRTSVLLSTKGGAFFSIILADAWKTAPFVALLLLAGLQTISPALYEAAQMDGAGRWRQFLHVTLPCLKTTFLVTLMFRTLDAFRVFDLIYVLTGGGPANATESLSIYAYKTMFSELDFGAGSALSVLVFLCIAAICTIYIMLLGKDAVSRTGR
jgi:multiple sugar transport system permease protein